jgi:hypothetical protein
LVDITDSFMSSGLSGAGLSETYDAYRDDDANVLISAAGDLSLALNHVARSMGVSDIYPFVLSGAVREKLAFVHYWVRAGAA